MEGNCDIWFDVDFGKGSVEVRCTQVGVHNQHRCEVFYNVGKNEAKRIPPVERNIFEGNESERN